MTDPRKALFNAVLRQAIEDAVTTHVDVEAQLEKPKARAWLTKPDPWFDEVAEIVEIDPERARLKFKAYIAQTDANGGKPPRFDLREIAEYVPATVDPAVMARTTPVRPIDSPLKQTRGRKRHTITYRGKALSINEWAKELGISPCTIRTRLTARLPLDEVFAPYTGRKPRKVIEYQGEELSLQKLADRTGIPYPTLFSRHRRGLTGDALIAPSGPQGPAQRKDRPGGGSELPSIGRDRRGTLRTSDAEIGVF